MCLYVSFDALSSFTVYFQKLRQRLKKKKEGVPPSYPTLLPPPPPPLQATCNTKFSVRSDRSYAAHARSKKRTFFSLLPFPPGRGNIGFCVCCPSDFYQSPVDARGVQTWSFYNKKTAPPYWTLQFLTLWHYCLKRGGSVWNFTDFEERRIIERHLTQTSAHLIIKLVLFGNIVKWRN